MSQTTSEAAIFFVIRYVVFFKYNAPITNAVPEISAPAKPECQRKSFQIKGIISTAGKGSHTAPICPTPGVILSIIFLAVLSREIASPYARFCCP